MSSQEQRSPDAEGQESLELNKETLRDLDLTPTDETNVMGGGTSLYYYPVSGNLYLTPPTSVGQSLRSLPSSVPSGGSVSG